MRQTQDKHAITKAKVIFRNDTETQEIATIELKTHDISWLLLHVYCFGVNDVALLEKCDNGARKATGWRRK